LLRCLWTYRISRTFTCFPFRRIWRIFVFVAPRNSKNPEWMQKFSLSIQRTKQQNVLDSIVGH